MKTIYHLFLISVIILSISGQETIKQAKKTNSYTAFTFGSCNRVQEGRESVIFKDIEQHYSDVFVWLGDAAYTDKRILPFIWTTNTDDKVKEQFDLSFNDPHYTSFREKQKILGVYDDHDINQNNADYTNPSKESARQLFLDFLEEPKDSSRRTNPNGIFTSYYMGDKRVKLILLDVRFNRNLSTGDSLGEAQWQWLEKELQDENPFIFFIGSGVQILPDDRISENILPESKKRLIDLIRKYQRKVVLLTGDIHTGEVLSEPCTTEYLGYPLLEVTASGLNVLKDEVIQLLGTIYEGITPNTYSQPWDRTQELNYGKVSIEWDRNIEDSVVYLEVYTIGNHEEPKFKRAFYLNNSEIKDYDENLVIDCPVNSRSPLIRFIERCLGHLIEGNWIVWVFFVLIMLNIVLITSCCMLCIQGKIDERRYIKAMEAKKKQHLQQQQKQQQEQKKEQKSDDKKEKKE